MKDVEIVDLGGDPTPPGTRTGPSDARTGPPGPRAETSDARAGFARDHRPTSRTSPRPVPLVAAAVTLVVAAVLAVAAFAGWRSRTHVVTTVRTVPAAMPTTVDALGCPEGSTCTVSIVPIPAQLNAITAWNPDAVIDSSVVVYDDDNAAVHALLVLEVGHPRTVVTITSQCVPGGAAVPVSRRTGRDATSVTVGGRAGCSVVVTGSLGTSALSRLAHKRGLQL